MSLAGQGYFITNKDQNQDWGPKEYKILVEESGGGTFARESSQATVTYICEYYYVEKFLESVLGKSFKGGAGIYRGGNSSTEGYATLPEEHVYYYNFYASSATIVPIGKCLMDNEGEPIWAKAKVNVVFRPPTYRILPDNGPGDGAPELHRFVTKTPEGDAEIQTALGYFKFVGDPNHRQLDLSPGFTVASQRFTYTWHQIPVAGGDLGKVPNVNTILPRVGTVNYTTFDGYAPGTVLFTSWSAKLVLPQVATQNNYYWDISYVMSVRDYGSSSTPKVPGERIGHNYAFDPLRGVWDLYTSGPNAGSTAGNTMYNYTDLNNLFQATW